VTGDLSIVERVVENLGVSGLLIFVVYRLMDRWAAKFLAGHLAQGTAIAKQAEAMAVQAQAFLQLYEGHKELTLAVRVVAVKMRRVLKEPASDMELTMLAELQARAELEAENYKKERPPHE
jgi:hypothetical protein